jgi:hypothetical protein
METEDNGEQFSGVVSWFVAMATTEQLRMKEW